MYKLSVHVSEDDEGKPLQISHTPVMTAEESRKVGLAIRVSLSSCFLSVFLFMFIILNSDFVGN